MSELLVPNATDAQEMAVYDKIPHHDRQAWLHFLHESHRKEHIGIGPAYTFDQFDKGIAPHIPGLIGIVDDIAEKGLHNVPLVPNFRNGLELHTESEQSIHVAPLLTAFDGTKKIFEKARSKGPIAIELPHTSLASPFALVRSLIETHGSELAEKIYIVIGPRPAVIQFETYSQQDQEIKIVSPVLFGRALGHVLLTGPDTDSTRLQNEELVEWLKVLRRNFYESYNEIIEPQPDGDNHVVIFCPSGRVAEEQASGRIKEFRTDGSFKYLMRPQLQIWPVGVYDRLLSSPDHPESIVFVYPDKSIWPAPADEHEAQWYHERAVLLSNNPLGGVEMESVQAQNFRLTKQKVRNYVNKIAKRPNRSPYLFE